LEALVRVETAIQEGQKIAHGTRKKEPFQEKLKGGWRREVKRGSVPHSVSLREKMKMTQATP